MNTSRGLPAGARMRIACLGRVLLLAAVPSTVLAQCPESVLTFPGPTVSTTTSPTYDVTYSDGSRIQGDHRIGRFVVHHTGALAPTDLVARDRYDVTGVPPGTAVAVTLRLNVVGWAYTPGCGGSGCCGYLVATVRAGADTSQTELVGQTFGGRADFSGWVAIPVTLTAGAPHDFEIEMFARRCPGGFHSVDATGQITFEGSDSDAAVISCKQFGPKAVPVLPRTWGWLKTIYR